MVNWSQDIKRTLPFNCNNIKQDKTKARKASIDEPRLVRLVLMIGKARR